MRKTFLDINDFATSIEAEKECPWACAIEAVAGGWVAFESATDWEVWLDQV